MDNNSNLLSFEGKKFCDSDSIQIVEAKISQPRRGVTYSSGSKKFQRCIALNPEKTTHKVLSYEPAVEEPALYRIAANLMMTQDAILNFCKDWGMLRLGSYGQIKGLKDEPLREIDRLVDIENEFSTLNQIVDLFDLLRRLDSQHRSPNWRIAQTDKYGITWVESKGSDRKGVFLEKYGGDKRDIIRIADDYNESRKIPEPILWKNDRSAIIYYITSILNQKLRNHTHTKVLYINDKFKPKHLWKTGCFIQPKSLIGLIWYQFADEMQGGRTSYKCLNCSKPFAKVIKPRRKPKYCTDSCRSLAYQKRKKLSLSSQ